jgi:hypothetical protein
MLLKVSKCHSQMVWSRLQKLLTKDKADPKTMTSRYKAMVQAVLLCEAESLVLTGTMEKTLQSFHRKNVQDTLQDNISDQTPMMLKEIHGYVPQAQVYWKK